MQQLVLWKTDILPLIYRHPWIFSKAIAKIPDGLESGTPVQLVDKHGNFIAGGYFNSYSQIAVRIWTYDKDAVIDADFFISKVQKAYDIRRFYIDQELTNAYRLINSENDFLPGLVVDKYADYLVVQFHTRGSEKWKKEIISSLRKVIKPVGIYERSSSSSREVERMEDQQGLAWGKMEGTVTILENGLKFIVNIEQGQKTGFFLDQRDKRLALQKYCVKKSVLNCFSYTGGFSVYALSAGAKSVASVDSSQSALDVAEKNIALNKFNKKKNSFVCEDVKQYLRKPEINEKFDVIVLDPPAFIKDRKKKEQGVSGYRLINELAFKILPHDGILMTCSCSAHLSPTEFRYIVAESAVRAGRSFKILEEFTHGVDHLELVSFMESSYLKVIVGIVE